MTIRKNVEFILRLKGMNKTELAEQMRMAPSNLTFLLDSSNIGLESIRKIAKALGTRTQDLVAYPPLNNRHKPLPSSERPNKPEPTHSTFFCPECGTKMRITIEPYDESK